MTDKVVFIGTETFLVEWDEVRDSGGMFGDTVGVYKNDGKYVAYIKWWGGGRKSPPHDTFESARQDVERLWKATYGY